MNTRPTTLRCGWTGIHPATVQPDGRGTIERMTHFGNLLAPPTKLPEDPAVARLAAGERVAYISDVLDPQTRTARVRCEVSNREMKLKTDMFANIELPTKFSKAALAVPSSALQDVEGKNVVFIQHSPTKFEARQVEKGVTVNGQTELISGVSAGEKVVTQGAFHLKSILAGNELGED